LMVCDREVDLVWVGGGEEKQLSIIKGYCYNIKNEFSLLGNWLEWQLIGSCNKFYFHQCQFLFIFSLI
jgi:hypothetical protein